MEYTGLSNADGPVNSQNGPSISASTTTSSNLGISPHPEIWFDDGNVVLVTGETGFRIYRGLLAGQSTIFADMFASSASPDETFDLCPVVHLSDSPHDLAHLLRVLLPQSRIHYHATKANRTRTFDELSAVIRLAHKYDIQQVQDQALAFLRGCGFVTSPTAFFRPCPSPNPPMIALQPAHYIGVVNLARLTDTPSLLPLAFYNCAHRGSALLDGWTREDGTVERLSDADLRRCIDAHVVLTDERTLFLCRLFRDTPSEGYKRPERCVEELRRLQRNTMRPEVLSRRVHVHAGWQGAIELLRESGALCKRCVEELLQRNERERKKVFVRLPEIFDIAVEGWGAEMETEAGLV